MAELQNIVNYLSSVNPPVTLGQIVRFLAFASRLKNEILLVQPGSFLPSGRALPALSPSIEQFLSGASQIPLSSISAVWSILGHTAWNLDLDILPSSGIPTVRSIFVNFGLSRGISKEFISNFNHFESDD
jgi:hypothetical protein